MVKFFSSTKGFSPLQRALPTPSSHRRSRSGGGGAGSNPAGGTAGGTAKPQVTGLPAASSPASVRGQSANSPQDLQLTVATHGPNNYVITSKIERRANAGGCYVRVKKAAYGGHPRSSKYASTSASSAEARVEYGLTHAARPQAIRTTRAGPCVGAEIAPPMPYPQRGCASASFVIRATNFVSKSTGTAR
jgi:hypothetical protein